MNKIFLLFYVLLIFFIQESVAENKNPIDSLKVELKKAKNDATRLNIYFELASRFSTKDKLSYMETALKICDKILSETNDVEKRKKTLTQKARIYFQHALFYDDKGDTTNMMRYYKKSLSIFQGIQDTANIAFLINNISYSYSRSGNLSLSLDYLQKGLSTSIEMNYKKGVAMFLLRIGRMFKDQGNVTEALENMEKAVVIFFEIHDLRSSADALIQTGIPYSKINNINKALNCFQKAISINQEIKNNYGTRSAYYQIGEMYQQANDFPNALTNYEKSLSIGTEMKNSVWIPKLLDAIGNVYTKQGNISKAIEYIFKALKINQEVKFDGGIATCYTSLAHAYFKQKNYKMAKECIDRAIWSQSYANEIRDGELLASRIDSSNGNTNGAYEHFKKYIILRDKLNNEDVRKAAIKAKFQTEYDKRKLVDKKEQEKKDEISKAESKKQKLIILIIGMSLLFVLVFAVFVFRSLRARNKQNKIISEQKKVVENQKYLVEEKNREILDSIEYALRIQTAILPPQKIVQKYLESSFILYKPKDIVAGDFYWMETVDDLILFAACDCTGHGVPGAMVSVVCHNALNRALREFGLTKPSKILDKTAEIVLENFSKSDQEIHDGMDISICALSIKKRTLEWAGANNSLIFINNGQLIETKADKQCIGYNDNVKPFNNHQFILQPETSIYLFTDGYSDQFGGQREKKLTKSKFKELLLSIQHLPIQQQATELDEFITTYKKETEQTDDILVIGVRV